MLDSLVFAALETPLDHEHIAGLFEDKGDPMGAYYKAIHEWRVQMRGGAMIPLPPGTQLKPFAPNRQPSAIDAFSTVMLRHIATGLNMPYELIFRDFSKTNYSSARAALLEAWRYFMAVRQYVADHWASIIFDLWFEEAVHRGRIPDCTPADYYANQVAWTRCKWIGSGRGWVDPFKEARASSERLGNGVSTLEDECAEQGRDWREVMEQRAREAQLAQELGLPPPHGEADEGGDAGAVGAPEGEEGGDGEGEEGDAEETAAI